jgi:hypothetical protein
MHTILLLTVSDARPQAWKNWRRIRWNTLRIFRAEHDTDGRRSFAGVERSMSDRLLRTPESFPILLPDLQRSKHIDRKTSGQLSLGFITHYLFVQNERHGF